MVELEKVLHGLVSPMVQDPNSISVRQMSSLNDNETILYVYAKSDDVAKLIGKQGMMAHALRQMISIASYDSDKKITVKFESL